MKPEEKQLLLKDLCARLPYGLKVKCEKYPFPVTVLYAGYIDEVKFLETGGIENIYIVKPYLRPMLSMTGEEMFEIEMMNNHSIQRIDTVGVRFKSFYDTAYNEMYDLFDWLNAHHFDYRGLIEKGLALEAKEGMYNI